MKQLSPKARAMLDALQTVDSPAADIETRAWSAVVARTAAGDLGPQIPVDASATATASAAGGLAKTLVIVGIAAAIATAIGIGVATTHDDPTPVQRLVGSRVILASPAPAATPEPEPEPELVERQLPVASSVAPEPAPTKAIRPRAKSERAFEAPTSDGPDALEREMRLMSEARAALGAGDAARAIGLLKDHAKQFPKGAFVLEREVSWITALCALGKTDAARTRADGFLRTHGKHPLAAKVRASCGGITP